MLMYFSTNFIVLKIIWVRIILKFQLFLERREYISEKLHQLHVYIVTLNKKLKAMKAMKLQEKNLKQNRGMLLHQLGHKNIAKKMLFSLYGLEKATHSFNGRHTK
jgi:hypothetical protein